MNPRRLLIVEGESNETSDLKRRLIELGHEIAGSTERGDAALSLAESILPDLVLMAGWPDERTDCITAAKRVLGRLGLPVVLLTSRAERDAWKAVKTAVASVCLLKPFEDRDLEVAIEMALSQHEAQQRLEESEARNRALLQTTMEGFCLADTQGRLLDVNEAYCRMSGYSREELLRMRVSDLEAREGDRLMSTRIRTVIREGSNRFESRHRRRDGTHFAVEVSVRYFQGGEGQVLIFLRDLTERQRVEADFEMIFTHMIDGFALHEIICDAKGKPVDYRFLKINSSFERLTGWTELQVIGRTIREINPQIESFWIDTYGSVALTGKPAIFEHLERDSGRHFKVEAFRPAIGRFACVFVDVTERKQAEEEAKRYQSQLEAIYENAPVMMCLLNENREVERMNRAMAEFVGRERALGTLRRPGDLLGCLNAFDSPDGCGNGPNCQTCALRLSALETFTSGIPVNRLEKTLVLCNEGARREVRLSLSIARVQNDGETRLLLCLEDLTARHQLERQYLQAQKMEAVGQLAGGVAHDFNNILAGMMMQLHLLGQIRAADLELVGSLKELEQHAQRAADLTRQLLLFSRRQATQTKRLDLNRVIEGMVKILRRLLGEHLELNFQAASEPQGVDADNGMLEQVVMNLCLNARDAMPKSGLLTITTAAVEIRPDQTLETSEARPGAFVCLTVRDTGCGMSDAILKHIFEPFFTTKEVGRGTGLGLATVYGIIKQHQGWVEVESTVGVGSIFRVYLPAVPLSASSAGEKTSSVLPRGKETILLVEDEQTLLKVVSLVLRRCGYCVLEARNGVDALRVWEETGRRADLVLTDMVMPGGLGGLELVEQLRQSRPTLKVILSSGYSLALARNKFTADRNLRLLPKPFTPPALANLVREVLDGEEPG